MTRFRFILLGSLLFLILLTALWLWSNRTLPVDMTEYAPADALVYVEANDLPRIATALASTAAWRALAEPAGMDFNPVRFEWLTTAVARTGIGSATAVILARAQVAVVVLGVEAAETDEVTIKPRLAVVVETHTSAWRTRHGMEKLVGDFARRAYGNPQVSTRERNEVAWTTWALPAERRQIVLATRGSIAIIGNDEQAVEACLAVQRGERQSLHGDGSLDEMRRRTAADGALAFGYISPANAAKLLEIGATVYAARLTLPPQAQSTAATLLPQILPRLIGAVGWSAHADAERIEDRYFFQVPETIAARLRDALAPAHQIDFTFAELLPAEAHQVSAYLYRDPAAAWRGAQAALSSQLDAVYAPLLILFADKLLEPYGIASPREFLRHTAPAIATARLDSETNDTVIVARLRDREAITRLLRARFGARTEVMAENTVFVRADDGGGEAAVIIGDHLLMGATDAVRRCLIARNEGRTLIQDGSFGRAFHSAKGNLAQGSAEVASYSDDDTEVRETLRVLATLRANDARDTTRLGQALEEHAYVVSETRLVEGGFEKRTRSVFGLFGKLVAQLDANE